MKFIVYDDNPDFGGHQVMACLGVEALAADPSNEILFLLNPENRRLATRLADIRACQILEAPCSTRKFQALLNHIDHRGMHEIQQVLRQQQPDAVLCIQGDIEDSSQALIAAHNAGIECISYIALPHRMETMGARLGKQRDAANQYLFKKPSRYISISGSMADLLRARGVVQPIAIVPNGIAPPCSSFTPHTSRLTLGMLGRIEFKQKQQDFLVRAFCGFQQNFESCRLLIAGDGPDRGKLEKIISSCPRKDDIETLPWQNDAEAFYSAIDLLAIPSRFEGMPLVMLEALARGIPVIGSNRDGMKEILPENWTFEAENAEALARTFSYVRDNGQQSIAALSEKIQSDHSLETFKTNFVNAVLKRV